ECAAIACVLLGLAATSGHVPGDLSQATGPGGHALNDLSRTIYEAALARITAALRGPAPDLRFQAAGGLVDLAGRAADPAPCAPPPGEPPPRVRIALVAALAELDPPGPDACAALAALVADLGAPEELAFPAALGLAAARDPRGGPVLVRALARADDRARALE